MILKAHSFSFAMLFSPNYFSTLYVDIGYRSKSWITGPATGYWSSNWGRTIRAAQSKIGTRDFGKSTHWSRNI